MGLWNNTESVAVKTFKTGSMSDFLVEAQIMKKLRHKKIIQLYAACTKREPLYIVMELMMYGRLQDYLQEGKGRHLKLPRLIDIGSQIACGMAYLERQHYIHRELAAKNVLVGEGGLVKIANFGLARQMNHESKTDLRLLIRWTAPEALQYKRFSIKSDVWSFGIVLWEVVTYGREPYPGMKNEEVKTKVKEGYHMPHLSQCPDPLYQIMLNCWKTVPEERPTFESLQHQLENYFVSTEDDTVSVVSEDTEI